MAASPEICLWKPVRPQARKIGSASAAICHIIAVSSPGSVSEVSSAGSRPGCRPSCPGSRSWDGCYSTLSFKKLTL